MQWIFQCVALTFK